MNSYAHAEITKFAVADRLLAAERARTARAARAAQAHRRGTKPSRRQGTFTVRRIRLLAWARTA